MPKVLEITGEYRPGLYDSDTGESLVTEKAVDITDQVCDGERTILLFTRAKRGRIVQIAHPYPEEEYLGSHIHFFFDEPMKGEGGAFDYMRRHCGIAPVKFKMLLNEYAPSATPQTSMAVKPSQ